MLAKVRARVGARAEILGYLLTMVDRREKITTEVEALLRKTFGDQVLPDPIRASTRHKACSSHRETIFQYDGPRSRGRVDYEKLTREVMARTGMTSHDGTVVHRPGVSSPDAGACAPRASSASA